MRRFLLLSLLTVGLFALSCADDPATRPDPAQYGIGAPSAPGALPQSDVLPAGYYSFRWYNEPYFMYCGFEKIDTHDGHGDVIWILGQDPALGETPLGLAFDLDGSMYTTLNFMSFNEAECYSQFARVDPLTGAVTPIGPHLGMNTCGPDIDAQGNFYTFGMDVPHLGYIHGDGYLYSFNKATGVATRAPMYSGMTDWMDLAFDSRGRLWATTQNQLWTIDTQTGVGTFVTHIYGVPDADPPHFMEVMSIAFDKNDNLYATAMTTFWDDPNGSPVLKINTTTGSATLLGYTHEYYNHGGDIMPTKVRVAHLMGNGNYKMINVAMDALPAHLAHGDYVPGTVGDPNYPD